MMAKIAKRRAFKTKSPKSGLPSRARGERCSASGTMMSFDSITDSATHSTITIAVAADRPPMKTATLSNDASPSIGSASTYMSGSTAPNGKLITPAGAGHLRGGRVLDDADVELARQQHDRAERQQRHGQEIADRWHVFEGAF